MNEHFSEKNACALQDFLYYMQNNVFYTKHEVRLKQNQGSFPLKCWERAEAVGVNVNVFVHEDSRPQAPA